MAELIVTVIVACLGSGWLGQILVNRFSKNSNSAILHKIDENDARVNGRIDGIVEIVNRNEADRWRERILRFNVEILRHEKHTREDFIDVLAVIDRYEDYCSNNPKYPNNRAVMAIDNIRRVYKKCMEENTFL